jgi:hypothetical protein
MRHATPLLKNIIARGLLALVFLFAQQTASLHWLSHAIDAAQAKAGQSTPPADHCDQCLTLSVFGGVAASAGNASAFAAASHVLHAPRVALHAPTALRLAFRSRAPPVGV